MNTSFLKNASVRDAIFLSLAIFIHICFQFKDISNYSYSPDEIMHIHLANASSLHDVVKYSTFEAHPALGNIIRHYWMQIDDSPESLRFLSLFFGCLTAIALYFCGKLLSGSAAGLMAAYFCLFSESAFALSYTIRNYTMLCCFMAGMYYFYLQFRLKDKPLYLYGYGLFAAASIYTHYSAIFMILAITIVQFYQGYKRDGRITRNGIFWMLVSGVLGGVFLLVYYNGLSWVADAYKEEYKQYFLSEKLAIRLAMLIELFILTLEQSIQTISSSILVLFYLLGIWVLFSIQLLKKNPETLILTAMMLLYILAECGGESLALSVRHIYFFSIPVILLASSSITELLRKYVSTKSSLQGDIPAFVSWILIIMLSVASMNHQNRDNMDITDSRDHEAVFNAEIAKITGPENLIIAPKMYAFIVLGAKNNLYQFFPNQRVSKYVMIQVAGQNIAFNPAVSRFYTPDNLQQALLQIQHDYGTGQYKHIYFINARWLDTPIDQLLKCTALKGKAELVTAKDMKTRLIKLPVESVFGDIGTNNNLLAKCFAELKKPGA